MGSSWQGYPLTSKTFSCYRPLIRPRASAPKIYRILKSVALAVAWLSAHQVRIIRSMFPFRQIRATHTLRKVKSLRKQLSSTSTFGISSFSSPLLPFRGKFGIESLTMQFPSRTYARLPVTFYLNFPKTIQSKSTKYYHNSSHVELIIIPQRKMFNYTVSKYRSHTITYNCHNV